MIKTVNCPVCSTNTSHVFVDRRRVPSMQNFLCHTLGEAQAVSRGDLEIRICHHCGFGFNATFDGAQISYSDRYDNANTFSPSFEAHVESLVRYVIQGRGAANCTVVEVGCGNGAFLRKLVGKGEHGIRAYGFDPAYSGPLEDAGGLIHFEQSYYGPEHTAIRADLVICRHVIEHVQSPVALLQTIRAALANSPQARVCLETPCLEWILAHTSIWDFFYEHCSYFSTASLTSAFARAGLTVDVARHVFDGQYLWLEGILPATQAQPSDSAGNLPTLASAYTAAEASIMARLRTLAQQAASRGKLALWGAGAKGVTLANLLDPEGVLIDCLVELNPRKQGCFVPGTGHPVVSPTDLHERAIRTAWVLNPNYFIEIQQMVADLHEDVELVNLGDLS